MWQTCPVQSKLDIKIFFFTSFKTTMKQKLYGQAFDTISEYLEMDRLATYGNCYHFLVEDTMAQLVRA